MNEQTSPAVGAPVEAPVRPRAWLVTPLVEGGDDDACAWMREPNTGDYATWAKCGVNVRVTPLYERPTLTERQSRALQLVLIHYGDDPRTNCLRELLGLGA